MNCRIAFAVFAATGAAFAAGEAEAPSWSWSLTGTQYWLPNEPDFLLGIGIAKHGSLHLETRWQYEDLRSLSAFAGWTFFAGDAVHVEATPMAGPLIGRTTGLIPGLELTVGWRWLTFYTEDEYVFDLGDSSANYFYAWTELTATPVEFLTVGLVGQRTRQVHTSLDIQRGLLARLTWGPLTLGVYAFNIGTSDWYLSTGLTFAH
jgi:hypothetical protein